MAPASARYGNYPILLRADQSHNMNRALVPIPRNVGCRHAQRHSIRAPDVLSRPKTRPITQLWEPVLSAVQSPRSARRSFDVQMLICCASLLLKKYAALRAPGGGSPFQPSLLAAAERILGHFESRPARRILYARTAIHRPALIDYSKSMQR